MLVNHIHKFLFVHIQKTAGLSITDSLMQIAGTQSLGYQHSFINLLDLHQYSGYFKFCFVRNPYDRLVSWYNMMINHGVDNDFSRYMMKGRNFSEFLDRTEIIYEADPKEKANGEYPKSIAFNQLDYITDREGKIAVDFIGRFENLENDFRLICLRLDIPFRLGHKNKYNHSGYRTYYKTNDIEKVQKLYERDLEYFKYTF